MDSSLLDRAIKFAVDAHSNSERRGKGYPYIIHPMEAMSIVSTLTPDQEILAAAALHDTVEDTDVTLDRIREEFGDRIASIVDAESDNVGPASGKALNWRERKRFAMDKLASASMDAKMAAIGDKLSNLRAIARDYAVKGDALWSLFHAPGGREDHEWHYRCLAEALKDLKGTAPYEEFVKLLDDVFGRKNTSGNQDV